jgi:hypothetical protein
MTTNGSSREPIPNQEAVPVLPPPAGRPAREWADKVVTAEAARALGRRLREGKPLVFSDGRHPVG